MVIGVLCLESYESTHVIKCCRITHRGIFKKYMQKRENPSKVCRLVNYCANINFLVKCHYGGSWLMGIWGLSVLLCHRLMKKK